VTVVVVVRALRASPNRKTNLRERDSSSSRESEFPKGQKPQFPQTKTQEKR